MRQASSSLSSSSPSSSSSSSSAQSVQPATAQDDDSTSDDEVDAAAAASGKKGRQAAPVNAIILACAFDLQDERNKKCLFCDYSTSTRTNNLTRSHFRKVHDRVYDKVKSMLAVENKLEDEVKSWLKKEAEKVATANALKKKNEQASKMTHYFKSKASGEPSNDAVRPLILTALFIASTHTALSIVENEYFCALTGVRVSRRQMTRIVSCRRRHVSRGCATLHDQV